MPLLSLFGSSLPSGAEAIPDIDVAKKRFAMNIMLPSSDETGEIRLLFDSVSWQLFLCNRDYARREPGKQGTVLCTSVWDEESVPAE